MIKTGNSGHRLNLPAHQILALPNPSFELFLSRVNQWWEEMGVEDKLWGRCIIRCWSRDRSPKSFLTIFKSHAPVLPGQTEDAYLCVHGNVDTPLLYTGNNQGKAGEVALIAEEIMLGWLRIFKVSLHRGELCL